MTAHLFSVYDKEHPGGATDVIRKLYTERETIFYKTRISESPIGTVTILIDKNLNLNLFEIQNKF